MEDRKELNEILLGDKKSSSDGKKAIFVVIVAVIVFVVAAFVVWRFFISNQETISKPNTFVDTSTMKPLDPLDEDAFGNDFVGLDSQSPNASQVPDLNFGIDDGISSQQGEDAEIDDALNNIESIINPKPSKPTQNESKVEPKKSEPKVEARADTKSATPQAQAPQQASAKPGAQNTTDQPTSAPNVANALAPTRGFYWQVGSFSKEPSSEFLTLIKKYSYRIQHAKKDAMPTTRYLLGPYKSRSEAPNREEIAELFKENPIPIEIQ